MNDLYKEHKYAEVLELESKFNDIVDKFTETYINE